VRTFTYEFLDLFPDPGKTDMERHFGLLRSDGAPKPVFHAVKNLIAILKDPGLPHATGTLELAVGGATKNVHRTLLQKRDGTYWLVLWIEVCGYDIVKKQEIAVAPQEVVVTPGVPLAKAVFYKPVRSAEPAGDQAAPSRLVLSVTDEPLVVQLVPRSSGGGR